MSELFQTIQNDLKQAMRDKNALKLSTLRMLISEIKKLQIDKKITASDTDVISIASKMIKQRQDSAQAFQQAQRDEMAQKELDEISFLKHYLPEQMSQSDIEAAIKTAISESGASQMSDMGSVMAILTPKLKGRADMKQVSQFVRAQLS